MFAFLKAEKSEQIEGTLQKNPLMRFLTSHTALVFCYGIFLFLYEIKFLREVIPVVHPVLIGWAGLLAVYDIVVRRLWEKLPLWQPLAVFAVLAGITALVNHQAGLVGNLKVWVMAVLPLVAFLPLCLLAKDREKALLKALSGGAAVVFLASLAAVVMYLLRISARVDLWGLSHMVGFRYYIMDEPDSGVLLYGLYTDTNHASAYAILFSAYSLWLLDACRRGVCGKAVKVFAVANLIVQVIYFPLANSRGGWLCLVLAGMIGVFLYAFCTRLKTEGKWKRAALSLVAAVVCVALVCGGLLAVRSGVSLLSRGINGTAAHPGVPEDPTAPSEPEISWGEQGADTFTKTDDGFGAGRLLIWGEGMRLFVKNPLLGIGTGNSAYYARLYDLGFKLQEGAAMHNSFLDLLVDYGVLGFGALMAFFGACLWLALRHFFTEGRKVEKTTYLAAFCGVFLAGVGLFLSCTFINTTAMYYLMLLFIGYLLAACGKQVDKKEQV